MRSGKLFCPAILALAAACAAQRPAVDYAVTLASRHEDRDAGYEEFNPGLTVEGRWAPGFLGIEPGLGIGAARNSEGDFSPHVAGALWRDLPGPFESGIIAGTALYSEGLQPLGALVLGLDRGWKVRPRLLYIPDAAGYGWVLVGQLVF